MWWECWFFSPPPEVWEEHTVIGMSSPIWARFCTQWFVFVSARKERNRCAIIIKKILRIWPFHGRILFAIFSYLHRKYFHKRNQFDKIYIFLVERFCNEWFIAEFLFSLLTIVILLFMWISIRWFSAKIVQILRKKLSNDSHCSSQRLRKTIPIWLL